MVLLALASTNEKQVSQRFSLSLALFWSNAQVLMNHSLCITSSVDNRASPHDRSITLLISGGGHTAQTSKQTFSFTNAATSFQEGVILLSVYLSISLEQHLEPHSNDTGNETSGALIKTAVLSRETRRKGQSERQKRRASECVRERDTR